ncbi:DUF366 family protein [Methanobacterium formicicum]|uniref:DUF366 domain-containing protein n=1 Tax=Methanobacterium formicicum (strain DSM 3637 / PP1) TaxID=1204725 RepID=K2QEW2_METFP|nr:DUF366 family protein [Methanobacterium formicicum]EKF86636.1 hypothetical protein A994_00080 [Methanobacterium formicicum DSM 3637]
MKQKTLESGMLYDGSQINPMWAFQALGIKGSSIVTWIGPMNIHSDELIDYEDVGLEIKSDEMVHFIIEHFDIQPADMRLCYHRQRILVMIVKDLLEELGIKTLRKGDDIYLDGGKLSVSIATCSISSMKIHFAMNLTSQGTPDDVKTTGLTECKAHLTHEDVTKLAKNISERYVMEISDIEQDISKTRVF